MTFFYSASNSCSVVFSTQVLKVALAFPNAHSASRSVLSIKPKIIKIISAGTWGKFFN